MVALPSCVLPPPMVPYTFAQPPLANPFRAGVWFAKVTLRDVEIPTDDHRQPDQEAPPASTSGRAVPTPSVPDHNGAVSASAVLIPAFEPGAGLTKTDFRGRFTDACA